jgi:non-homologous end joining protein Ku
MGNPGQLIHRIIPSDLQTVFPPATIVVRAIIALLRPEAGGMIFDLLNLKDDIRSAHFADTTEAQRFGTGPDFIDMHASPH